MARRKSRIVAFQALYAWDISNTPLDDLLSFGWVEKGTLERMGEESLLFSRLLITGTLDHIDHIDEVIKKYLMNWDFSRLARVDLAILRISVYPLLYQKDIPASIIIDEAIDLCKEFASDDAYRFVNAVLDAVHKNNEVGK